MRTFHIVRSRDPKKIAQRLKPAPDQFKDEGRPIRHFPVENIWVSNFMGSASILSKEGKMRWKLFEIESGVYVSNIRGVQF